MTDNYDTTDTGTATVDADLHGQDQAPAEKQMSGVRRELGDVPQDRLDLCKEMTDWVKKARAFWEPDFKRMRKDQDFLIGLQYAGQTDIDAEERYIANITQRHVQQRTAAIYAKNPTVVARRKEMMDFMLWDENPLTAQMAMQAVSQAGMIAAGAQQGDPNALAQAQQAAASPVVQQEMAGAQALLQDIQQGMARRGLSSRIGRTMELYFKNKVLSQQFPPFKSSMKQLVRRTLACCVGYVKLGLVREMGEAPLTPDMLKGIATIEEQMATINRMMAELMDGDAMLEELSAEREELRLAMIALQERPMIATQEGLIFDFPSSTSIIPDPKMTQLQGFVGCEKVAEEFLLTPAQVEAIWKVDVKTGCTVYDPENSALTQASQSTTFGIGNDGKFKKGMVCVWIVYDRTTGLTYAICDGYKDFLEDPCVPKFALERFWPWFPLTFNQLEHHKQKMPLSDVHLLKSQQREINRAREAMREHRIASRPLTAVPKGMLEDEDITKLETRPANAVVQLNALPPGGKIDDILQTVKHPNINPEVYSTAEAFQDVLRVVGTQEANLGGTSSSTATESSIAESSRMSSLQSNIDDLDDFLTELMRAAGQVALMEIGQDEVKRIVGPGAAWPVLSKADVADEIFLEIQAGSSGRPNKAVEMQNMSQAMPFLLQIPGVRPDWLAKQLLMRMDDSLDLTDAFLAGQPSIQTLNAMAAKPLGQGPAGADRPGGPGAQDPNAQGPQGGQNAPAPGQAGGQLGPQVGNAAPPPPGGAAPIPVSG